MSKNFVPNRVIIQPIGEAELRGVVNIHMAAFPESALTMLGPAAVHRYYQWQLIGPHELTAFGAFIQDQIVGFCFGGIFRGAMSGFLRKNRRFLVGRVLSHPWYLLNPVFRARISKGWRGVFKLNKSKRSPAGSQSDALRTYGILAIAVGPPHQELGIGRLLMERAEDTARQLVFDEMRLTVQHDNQKAVRFYEDLHWEKVSRGGEWNGEMRKAVASDGAKRKTFYPRSEGLYPADGLPLERLNTKTFEV